MATVKSVQDALRAQTGNAVSPWQSEAERQAANNSWLAPYGLSADKNYNLFDANGNFAAPKTGSDGMGGVFNPQGNSSNPYFLQGTTGVNRNQLAGTGLENVSDKALKNAYSVNGPLSNASFANDLWVDPVTGSVSSVRSANSVSVGDIRKAIAGLTGQQYADPFGAAAPFVSPGYYDGASNNTSGMAERQQEWIAQQQAAARAAMQTATPPPVGENQTPPAGAPGEGGGRDILQEMLNPQNQAFLEWWIAELKRHREGIAAL